MVKRSLFLFCLIILLSCKVTRHNLQQSTFSTDFSNGLGEDWTVESHTFENNLANFSTANIAVQDQQLMLTLNKVENETKAYSGAEIRSKKKYLYGQFQARLKATQTLGCITAFFLYEPAGKTNQEIDFEISGKYPNRITLNHWIDKKSHDKDVDLSFNTTTAFHDYTIIWLPGKITWLVDGVVVHTTKEAVPDRPMQVIFNLWATKSEKWAGKITSAKLPAFAYVEKVKFEPYKK